MESLNINPWRDIWTQPRKTMRAILDWDKQKVIIWLAIINGLIAGFLWLAVIWTRYPDTALYKKGWFVVIELIFSAIFAVVMLYFLGWLYQFTGYWCGGKGKFQDVKCAVGWAIYPFLIANIFNLLTAIFVKKPWVSTVFSIIYFVLAIWAFVVFLHLLAEAHQFSVWKALLNVIIAFILIFVVIMLISLLVPLISPLFST